MLLFLSVFLIALIFSMFGLGGGLFYMPVFMFFLGDPVQAAFLSFLCIFVTAGSSAIQYLKFKKIDWKLVVFLGFPLIAMVFVSGFMIGLVNPGQTKFILGLTLILAGLSLCFPVGTLNTLSAFSRYFHKKIPLEKSNFDPLTISPLAAFVGFFCGLSGVAGGVFEVPMMIGLLRVSPHMAVGTSSMIVFLSGLLGFVSRISAVTAEHLLDFSTVIGVLACVFIGAQIGPAVSVGIDKKIFKRICGVFILLIGLCYIFKIIF
ncbi:MAG: sulfite exporter TauE/SafE family protein [Candidatus Omnitrophica bacterium]|nr:sulfite exporter TauE/SafE family protein [Candidatus Omnitrophota bacterium]